MGEISELLPSKAKFKAGETVQLKSGGPSMTVRSSTKQAGNRGATLVTCNWFVDGEDRQNDFLAEQLITWTPQADEESEPTSE